MSQDVKISESEMSIYCNQISSYNSYLIHSVDMCIALLDAAATSGIIDVKFNEAIAELKPKIRASAVLGADSVETMKGHVSKYVEAVQTSDNYVYSDEGMSSVVSVLKMFF